MSECVTAKATITKAELSSLIPLRGNLNRGPITIGGTTHEACTLKFKGFVGQYVATNQIEGEYTFLYAQPSDAEKDLCEFLDLPGLGPWTAPMIVKGTDEPVEEDANKESEVSDDGDRI